MSGSMGRAPPRSSTSDWTVGQVSAGDGHGEGRAPHLASLPLIVTFDQRCGGMGRMGSEAPHLASLPLTVTFEQRCGGWVT